MAQNTCKFNIGDIFRLVNYRMGLKLIPGQLGSNFTVRQFVDELNYCVQDLALETNLNHRLYILTPDRNWLRYVKVTPEEETTGIVRIDLEGQTPTPVTTTSPYIRITVANLNFGPSPGNTLTQAGSGAVMTVVDSSQTGNWIIGIDGGIGVWNTVNNVTSDDVVLPAMNPTPILPLTIELNYMTDAKCLDFQYEKVCTGDGHDPNFSGHSATSNVPTCPDSFPKIYLPAECNIAQADYGTITVAAQPTYMPPAGNANRLNVSGMQPTTPFVVDMRAVGYSTGDPTDTTNYPSTGDVNNFFINPFLIYMMRLMNYTTVGGAATDSAIPNSAEDYLNSTWTDILGLVDSLIPANNTVAAIGNGTFIMDNVMYDVFVNPGSDNWQVAADLPFIITLTNTFTGDVWYYTITPSHTPWQTVVQDNTHFTGLFDHNQTFYVAFNDLRLRLPDDVVEIEYLWKLPKDTYHRDVAQAVADPYTLSQLTDNESYMYNRQDYASHYFSVTETPFTRAKMYYSMYGESAFEGAGYYIQNGQQLRIVPPTADPVALLCRAMPDKIDPTIGINAFDTTYVEVPGISMKVLVSKLLYEHFLSSQGGDSGKTLGYKADYMEGLDEVRKRFIARGGQTRDNKMLSQRVPAREATRDYFFGSRLLGEPGE